jgi:hypothetical protein
VPYRLALLYSPGRVIEFEATAGRAEVAPAMHDLPGLLDARPTGLAYQRKNPAVRLAGWVAEAAGPCLACVRKGIVHRTHCRQAYPQAAAWTCGVADTRPVKISNVGGYPYAPDHE